MKTHLKFMLGFILAGSITFQGCKKEEIVEPEKELETFSGKPNLSANVPNWESYAKSELFPYGDGTQWKTLIPWDGQTFYMSNIHLRAGYAYGTAVAVITGTPESPTGEIGNLVTGESWEGPTRMFGYTKRSCNPPVINKLTSTWTNYSMTGKDNAGDTFTAFGSQFQQTNDWNLPIDNSASVDLGERFFDGSIQKVKITRVLFYGLGNCSFTPQLVTFKLAAVKDSQGVIHYYIAHPNFQEPKIIQLVDPGVE
ncbi:hypothetical protein [Pedobacter kyonggii]|uniref:Uncharacterized protein n=1 Tax=Pedobacter kyonggii TaxID=1926871 RepID=A0A4Q9HBQ2_9SPHI|nr:hypothetical protein [Pedobacter kyonggii]TBO41629.1 hypothetical protein EYS08_13950 [Pedobacter kyonggii]